MASKSTGSNKFLLLLIPVIAVGAVWGVKTIAGSAKNSESAAVTSSQSASKISPDVMTELQKPLTEAVDEIEGGDFAKPKREYAEWKETWNGQSVAFKQQSPEAYSKVEQAMQQVEASAINAPNPDKEAAIAAFKALNAAVGSVQSEAAVSTSQSTTVKLSPEVMTELQKPLTEAVEEIEGGDFAKPKREYAEWKETWKAQEVAFRRQSPASYEKVGQAYKQVEASFINAPNPDKEAAIAAFKSLSSAVGSGQ